MADNLTVTPGVGANIAADEITTRNGGTVAAELAQRVKAGWGVDGTFNDVTAAAPLPVTAVVTTLPALAAGANVIGAVTQSGTWTVGVSGSVAVTGTFWQATQPVSNAGTFAVQAAQSGTWNIATLTNLSQFGGFAINLGAGAVSTGTLRVTQASDSPLITVTGATTDAVVANGAAGTIAGYLRTIKDASTSTAVSAVSIDQTTPGTTNRVALPELTAAANVAKTYSGTFVVAASNLTRPANTTAYSALDSISNNATAGSVTANSVSLSDTNDHPIDLVEILLDSNDTGPGTAGAKITLHLFNSDPTALTGVIGGDNAAWSNKKAGWVGSFTGTMTLFSDGSRGVLIPDAGTLRMIAPTSGAKTVFWQLQTQTAFTPSAVSTVFLPTFKGFQSRPA